MNWNDQIRPGINVQVGSVLLKHHYISETKP